MINIADNNYHIATLRVYQSLIQRKLAPLAPLVLLALLVRLAFLSSLRKMTTAIATTTEQTALSVIFKDRMRDMPNNLDDKEILAYAKITKNIIELENELKQIGKGETKAQSAFSCVFKDRIQNMPDDIEDKGILVYAKNIIKLVRDINKIGQGKKNPKNKE